MALSSLFISHGSALTYWRTNPPWYVLEGGDRDIRSLRSCARTVEEFRSFNVPESEFGPVPIDVLVPAENSPRCPNRFKPHKQRHQLPHHALYPLWNGVFVVSPELCFVQMCRSLPFFESIELGMELCGTYALRPDSAEGMAQRDYALVKASSLKRRIESWQGLKGLVMARKAAKYIVGGSASPMETKLFMLLCLPLQYGGYNLGLPELNPKFDLTREEIEIVRRSSVKPDMLWRKHRLVIEYDGRQHEEKSQSNYDAMRKTILEGRGYTVRQVKRQQLYNPLAFHSFACSVASFLGVRQRPMTLKHQLAREELRSVLLSDSRNGKVTETRLPIGYEEGW